MKKICAILMTFLLCCSLLCACGEEPVESKKDTGAKIYEDLTQPVVDLLITDCITEEQVSAKVGYPVHLLSLGDSDTQAIYQSEDGACMVTISLKNQTRALFDSAINDLGDTVTLYDGVGEIAYWSSATGELLVYQSEYSLGVAVSIMGAENVEIQTRQIAEVMLGALQPVV